MHPPNSHVERRLVPLLLLLTGVSGLVDAASYLNLGHVFVANLTGNIVFVGFALAGATSLSLQSSAVAIGSFLVGALAAGRLARRLERGHLGLLRIMTAAQCVIVLMGIAIGLASPPSTGVTASAVVALLSAAMGVQSATTTRLKIPGFNSTVALTTMLSTLAAESQWAGGSGAHNARRLLAIASMFGGGLVGAVLTLRTVWLAPLVVAAFLLAVTSVASGRGGPLPGPSAPHRFPETRA
jgi:uncharacterized membrane protein YoaK (UPF0700 family)